MSAKREMKNINATREVIVVPIGAVIIPPRIASSRMECLFDELYGPAAMDRQRELADVVVPLVAVPRRDEQARRARRNNELLRLAVAVAAVADEEQLLELRLEGGEIAC